MVKGHEETFYQRGMDRTQVDVKKMLNIINH